MADPISIFGATASVLSIIDVLSKSISLLDILRSQWKTADLALLSLTSQLGALNAALVKIHEWTESGIDELHHQLVMDLKSSIDCCHILVSKVHGEIVELQKAPGGALLATAKARFTFKSNGISELQNMIDRQTSTLTLLLTACNSKSLSKQQEILGNSSVRKRIDIVQRDTASLASLVDSASFLSKSTEKSSKLSMLFDFDDELFTSRPYKTLIRKTVKFSIRYQHRRNLSESSQVSASIPNDANMRESQACTKVLLLGIGESSKTTFLKQMQIIYSQNSLMEDWVEWRNIIYDNLRTSFLTLLSVYNDHIWFTQSFIFGVASLHTMALSIQECLDSGPQDSLPPNFAEVLTMLLDGTAYITWESRDIDELRQNLDYFVKRLKRVCALGYRPSKEDVLYARARTTGFYKHVFHINDNECSVYDVGGERSERRKWIHVYRELKSPVVSIFVPISCYDQFLYEDNTMNRMEEALELFKSIANNPQFTQSKVLLCFTKIDVFESKIASGGNPLTRCFSDYEGPPTDVASARDFITAKFTGVLKTPRELSIYYIDATNTDDVRRVLANIFDDVPTYPPHFTFSKHADLDDIT